MEDYMKDWSCQANFKMFYYNPSTKSCNEMIYGGCGGTKNLFSSEEICIEKCPEANANYGKGLRFKSKRDFWLR